MDRNTPRKSVWPGLWGLSRKGVKEGRKGTKKNSNIFGELTGQPYVTVWDTYGPCVISFRRHWFVWFRLWIEPHPQSQTDKWTNLEDQTWDNIWTHTEVKEHRIPMTSNVRRYVRSVPSRHQSTVCANSILELKGHDRDYWLYQLPPLDWFIFCTVNTPPIFFFFKKYNLPVSSQSRLNKSLLRGTFTSCSS
jgi:hypothetical protein